MEKLSAKLHSLNSLSDPLYSKIQQKMLCSIVKYGPLHNPTVIQGVYNSKVEEQNRSAE